ncbi:high affinity cGMP-specific 3',5'-cyclic phosphodiesterase 9, partial [Schistosoma bovis]
VQQIFDHINMTKDEICQTDSKPNHNIVKKQLWDAFNTSYQNQEKILRPSHNDINAYHLDDDVDEDDDDDEEMIETHYDNVHSCRKMNNFSIDKMDTKRISKIYRQLHNLRCQVEVRRCYIYCCFLCLILQLNCLNEGSWSAIESSICEQNKVLMLPDIQTKLLRYHLILVRLQSILTFFILDNVLFTSNDFVFLSNNVAIIYKRLSSQSFSYLSWLGLTAEQPPTQKILVPGFNAPAPNPQMHLIRRSDADSRRNIQEFKLLCKEPVSKEDLIELRSSTFNNWSRTDAQLIRLVREMFQELGFIKHYNIQLHRLDLWLTDIYRRYNRCYVLIWGGNLTNLLDIDDQLILIISAICHDLDHPGFNNAYQINAGTVLAMRYNDQSPLENHHTAVAFDLLSHKEVDPFSHLSTTIRQRIRKGVIRCILATDMSRHNEILDEFNRQVLTDLNAAWEIDPNTKKPTWVMNKIQKDLVMVIILKISDISNEARPLNVAGPWINRLLAEFFHQSDYEKLVGLPVAPFMDRHKVTKSASQCGFIRFVILPLFESLAKLLPEVKPIIVQPALEQLAYYTDLQNNEEKKTNTDNQKSNNNEHQSDNNHNQDKKEHNK